MHFDGRLISEITEDDIRHLVENKVQEDETIEFKREPYGGTAQWNEKKLELCCDVASFANANGGYIIIGIGDRKGRANSLCAIPEPKPHIDRMLKVCLDGIEPRIADLQIEPISLGSEGSVIVIRIGQSTSQTHMVNHRHQTHFVRRYRDGKREMSYAEIRQAFLSDLPLRLLREMNAKLDELLQRSPWPAEAPPGAESNALEAETPQAVQAIMEARLREEAGQ